MTAPSKFSEVILLQGHIIDSLTFSKVLDRVMERGGRFTIQTIHVGQRKNERSRAVLKIEADSQPQLGELLKELRNLGAEILETENATLARAPRDGVFPEGFYATTNLETWVRLNGNWLRTAREEMDSGIRITRGGRRAE